MSDTVDLRTNIEHLCGGNGQTLPRAFVLSHRGLCALAELMASDTDARSKLLGHHCHGDWKGAKLHSTLEGKRNSLGHFLLCCALAVYPFSDPSGRLQLATRMCRSIETYMQDMAVKSSEAKDVCSLLDQFRHQLAADQDGERTHGGAYPWGRLRIEWPTHWGACVLIWLDDRKLMRN